MARLEDLQSRETQGIESRNAAFLSQSVQNMFETKSGPWAQNALPELLDFGTGTDLYLRPLILVTADLQRVFSWQTSQTTSQKCLEYSPRGSHYVS